MNPGECQTKNTRTPYDEKEDDDKPIIALDEGNSYIPSHFCTRNILELIRYSYDVCSYGYFVQVTSHC